MAKLTTNQKKSIAREWMARLSSDRTPVPINKVQIDALITLSDDAQETQDTTVYQAAVAADADIAAWILANTGIIRELFEIVARERKENI